MTRESKLEAYLSREVRNRGGSVRKASWLGRRGCPDRFVMLPKRQLWVECKTPDAARLFPSDGREKIQLLEILLMRSFGAEAYWLGDEEHVLWALGDQRSFSAWFALDRVPAALERAGLAAESLPKILESMK